MFLLGLVACFLLIDAETRWDRLLNEHIQNGHRLICPSLSVLNTVQPHRLISVCGTSAMGEDEAHQNFRCRPDYSLPLRGHFPLDSPQFPAGAEGEAGVHPPSSLLYADTGNKKKNLSDAVQLAFPDV